MVLPFLIYFQRHRSELDCSKLTSKPPKRLLSGRIGWVDQRRAKVLLMQLSH
jgi:hypothetical protein